MTSLEVTLKNWLTITCQANHWFMASGIWTLDTPLTEWNTSVVFLSGYRLCNVLRYLFNTSKHICHYAYAISVKLYFWWDNDLLMTKYQQHSDSKAYLVGIDWHAWVWIVFKRWRIRRVWRLCISILLPRTRSSDGWFGHERIGIDVGFAAVKWMEITESI